MMKSLRIFAVAAVLLSVPLRIWAAEPRLLRQVLDNGMIVLVNEMPSSPEVAIDAWVRTGSANEGKYIGSGITHFVEHMLFKGTAQRGVGVISDEARAMGGSINAATSHDYTVFTLSIPKENFPKGLVLLADMMQNAAFDKAEVERERDVILKEMRMANDQPGRKLDEAVYKAVYLAHPYRHPIIGYEPVFKGITRDQLLDYYRTYYAPNNMIFSVAGGVSGADVLAEIGKAFEGFTARSTPERVLPVEPQQVTPRFKSLEYPTDLIRLVVAYHGMPLFDRDLFAGDVLAMALGTGRSSRLHSELYEKKRLVESVGAGNDTPMDRGYFEVSALLKDDKVDEVVAAIQSIVDDVKVHGLLKAELDKVKRMVLAQNVYARETAEGMAYRAAMEEAFAGDAEFSDKYLDGIRAVTNEDVKRVAAKYLVPSARSVVVMRPRRAVASKKSEALAQIAGPEMSILPNGVRIILKRDPALPLVSLNVSFRGGLRQEPSDKPGLAELTGRAWERGVKGKTAEQLAKEIESRAGSLSAGIGLDSFGISIQVLSDDVVLALDDMELLLKAPSFFAEEMDKERKNMLTALMARKDSIAQTSFRALNELLFLKHPMRRDPLGTPDSLARLTRQDLVDFYSRCLSPDQMIVTVYGDIDKDKIKKELASRLGALKPLKTLQTLVSEPPIEAPRLKELAMDKEQAFVVYGFHGPLFASPDRYALDVAVNVLSSSLSGRMFKRIRDELGKAYALSGFCSPGIDEGVCAFYVLTTAENVDKVRALIEEELKNIREKPVSDKELADAKIYLKSDFARDGQTIAAQAGRDLADEFYGLGYKASEQYNGHIDVVTSEAVRQAADKYLDVSRSAVVITRPNL